MRLAILLVFGCLNWLSVSGQSSTTISQIEKGLLPSLILEGDTVKTFSIQDRMRHYNVPGVSIAVIQNGKIAWAKGYGLANRDANRPVDENTLFQAASISKPVAALAVLHWVEAGKLSLDANINDYLTDWKVPDSKFTATEKVTLRRLMTHTAGLTIHGFAGYAKGNPVPTLLQVLDGSGSSNSRAILTDTTPGAIYRYSGGGYTVMQKAMIDQLGKSFPQIMQETVLSKLGMVHSTYEQPLPTNFDALAAAAYKPKGEPVAGLWHTYPEMAAAGLWTTPSDLARYVIEIQQSVLGKSNKVISKAMANQMLTKQPGGSGLGPALRNNGDSLIFSHNGANEGFRCLFMAYARRGDGVVIMTNSDNGNPLIQELLNSVSAAYGWDFSKPKRLKPALLSSAQQKTLLGTYKRSNYVFDVTSRDGRLFMNPKWETGSLELIPESKTRFTTRDGQQLEFIYNSADDVTSAKLFGGVEFTKEK